MIKFVFLLVLVLGGMVAYVRFLERSTLFLPEKWMEGTPADAGMAYEEVFFPSENSLTLHGWFIPASSDPGHQPTLLYMHGNAGNISSRVQKAAILHQLDCNIFIFDYRGYGRSTGSPTENGMYADARAARAYLLTRKDIDQRKVVYFGVSLGGAAAVDLAARFPPAALILDSTFSSGADMARRIIPFIPPVILSVKLDSIGKISQVTVPKLFIHSPRDEVIPFSLGRKLYEAAPEPREFLSIQGGHNDNWFVSQEVYVGGIQAFLLTYQLMGERK